MASPWNAAIAYENLADAGVVTASSSVILAPATRLQDPHVARKWRGVSGDTEYVTVDLLSDRELDTVAMLGLNLTSAGITRVRVSSADPSAVAGEIYDSGSQSQVDARYSALVTLIPALVTGRYVRVDLSEPAAEFVEGGRIVVSKRHVFELNFSPEWNRAFVDRSRRTESRGGQIYIDPDNSYRTVTVTFPAIFEDQRYGFVEDLDLRNGTHEDVLLITNPASANLGRDSIWGLLNELQAVSQAPGWVNGAPVYARAYTVRERL